MLNLKRIGTLSVVTLGMLSVGLVSGVAAQKARSYELSLNTATKVGSQVLTPGDYKLKLEGSNAVFTKEGNRQSDAATFTSPATLEAGNAKFEHTAIHAVLDAGQQRIVAIELEGSKNLLKLN
jgi:hypothetical protein